MRKILSERRKKKGFTLIELIIVLAVIAIIAAIAIPNFTKVRADSKLKADTQSAETIKRITQTLLVEDKLIPGDTFTIKFSNTTDFGITGTITGSLKDKNDELKSYFKEVKKPQQDDKNSYVVTTQTKTGEGAAATTSDEVNVKVEKLE